MTSLPARTRLLASILFFATLLCIVLIVGVSGYASTQPNAFAAARGESLGVENTGWTIGGIATGLLLASHWMLTMVQVLILWQTSALMRQYRDDRALSPQAAGAIRNIGLGILLHAGLQVLRHPVDTLALTLDAPAGQHAVAITLGTNELGTALAGGIMLLIGVVMRQAVAVSQENQEFV